MSECFTRSSGPSTRFEIGVNEYNGIVWLQSWVQETVGGVYEDAPTSISWCTVPELLALRPSNRRRMLVPLNETNVYGWDERSLSSACVFQAVGANSLNGLKGANKDEFSGGCRSRPPMNLDDTSCNSRTKSSLGLNCYYTAVYILLKTGTRSRSLSASKSARYRTREYTLYQYLYTACLLYS